MEVNQYYKPERYKKAEIAEIKKFAKIRIRYLESHLKKNNPKKILELGCGEGSLAYEIKNLLYGVQIFGLDLSSEAVSLAKSKGIIAKRADLNKGIPFPFKFPKFLGLPYTLLDYLFSKSPSFARDIIIIAKK